ncbi:MAG: WecB/TagA/CpsF family glycosyltransferase [Candidatus Omnitrophota bacterium]
MIKKVSFLGISAAVLNRKEIVDVILEFAKGNRVRTAFYINAHCVNIARADKEYRDILNKADLVYSGGQGVVWAARFLDCPLPQRVNIIDFFDLLVKGLIEQEISIYLLGASQDVIKKAAWELKSKGLKITGYRDGFFDQDEEKEVIQEINNLRPNILLVGMGVPIQEKWVYNHLVELRVNLCWAVGGAFDLFAGRFRKTPAWISNCGLEWLYLGLQSPRRLLKRYLLGNFRFIFHTLKYKFRTR